MNFKELQDAVADKVQDTSSAIELSIPYRINEAIQIICEDADISSLKAVGAVNTVLSQAWVNVSTTYPTFGGKVTYVGTVDGKLRYLDGGLDALLEEYPDLTEEGDVEVCTLEGNILWYMPIPTAVTQLILVLRNIPTTLTADTDIPTDIPVFLHRSIIVPKAAQLIFSDIEDGIDGPKVNTDAMELAYLKAFGQLLAWASKRKTCVGRSKWDV